MILANIIAFFVLIISGASAAGLAIAVKIDRQRGDLRQRIRKEVRKNFHLQRIFSVEEFGYIERNFQNLVEVIIVCHMVENPSASLRDAVLDNFKEGVRYKFCVSQSNYAAARRKYQDWFRAIFDVACGECLENPEAQICGLDLDSVFQILPLRSEWTAWPYVFFVRMDEKGKSTVTALRGDQEREGIAENYVRLQPSEAKSILNAVNMAIDDGNQRIDELVNRATFDTGRTGAEAA